ncbi:DUF7168 domain-containing protein [Phreatobacter stygius]|uniref:DUF7168 domain-containing protein n=1 Tax=Phreatobacter stygius TaxID=1940610 RepID=UPI001476BB76|nr:DUF2786 domain-containing protein [Phreatobacter stygius]
MSTTREKVRAKIAALRRMTRAAGCTEAEALAAAALAARLMQEHLLKEVDLDIGEASAREPVVRPGWRTLLAATIARCTNTALIRIEDIEGRRPVASVMFIGTSPGPEVALYLRDVCFRAVDKQVAEFKTSTFYRRRRNLSTKRAAVADFTAALIMRLRMRLVDLFAPLKNDAARSLAEAARDRRFPSASGIKVPPRRSRFDEAGSLGWRAANDVALNRGVAGDPDAPKLIGQAP